MAQDDWIGKQLGSYRILSLIGRGGAGRVYKVQHTFLEREAAIKILRADLQTDDQHYGRFLQEARTIAKMRHPYVVQLYDFGLFKDTYYMVMRYVEGESLDQRLQAARESEQLLPAGEVWRIIRQMGEGLTYIHEQGIIHRDIKPANILLTQEGDVVISDFGVSKLLAGQGNTTTGSVTGTPAYMSPEQALGESIDHRTDLYSMAVIVYEMLVGHVPFEAPSPITVVLKHINEPVPPPRQLNPAVPVHVEAELLKALSKQPDNRHQSVAEFLRALSGTDQFRQAAIIRPLQDRPREREKAKETGPLRTAIHTRETDPLREQQLTFAEQIKTAIGPDGKEYIYVPAGPFWMGSPHDSDAPRRLVYVDGFYICRYPVTNAEYHAFVEATTYISPEHWQGGIYKAWKADQPVVYVSWHDATAYCRWAEGRLPSEAEWEKAARGTDERQYPWGNTFDPRRCNTREGGKNATTPVGRYSPDGDSPYGAGDMAGQVWEWVLDWYAPAYGGASPARNPLGPKTGQLKVIRGGSFTNNASLVTSYTRDRALPNVCAVNYGFRVRLSVEVFERNNNRASSNSEQSVS